MNTRTFLIVAATGLAYLLTVPTYRIVKRVRRRRAELRKRAFERKRYEAEERIYRTLGVG